MLLAWFERALDGAFQRYEFNRTVFVTIMFFSYIYHPVRGTFERKFGFTRHQEATAECDSANEHQWAWRGFPELPCLFVHYRYLSFIVMFLMMARTMFHEHLVQLVALANLGKPAHCYLMGHFVFYGSVDTYGAGLLSVSHIMWRLYQGQFNRPYSLDPFVALMIADQDLDNFDALLKQRRASSRRRTQASYVKRPLVPEDCCLLPLDGQPRKLELDHRRDRLFKHIFCYKLGQGHEANHQLRLNRTTASRRIMRQHMAKYFTFSLLAFLAAIVGVTTWVLLHLMNDKHYLRLYANCDLGLEQLRREKKVTDWSFHFTGHQLLALAVDFGFNFVIWFDSGMSVFSIWSAVYLLNYDSRQYLLQLHAQLRALEARVRANYHQKHDPSPHRIRIRGRDSDSPRPLALATWGRYDQQVGVAGSGGSHQGRLKAGLGREVCELQAQFYDFFRQVRNSDLFISDVITTTIFIWLTLFSVLTHISLKYLNSRGELDLVVVIFTIEFLALAVVTLGSFNLLKLHRDCLRTYPTLCALMAYDHSEHKRKFLKFLEFYTIKKSSAYTVFQQYSYTKTTCLSIFGWSLSCFFIFDGLLRQHERLTPS